jgi:hypothetical protein
VNSVGVFAGGPTAQACSATLAGGCSATVKAQVASLPANQLISLNALNNGSVVTVTNNQVRYIMNTGEAQTIFGTPFGNMPRNPALDARANLLNGTIYKNFKLGERANFEMHLTLNNALNHFNFSSIVPNLESAGVGLFGNDFANPAVTPTLNSQFGSRVIFVGGRVSF